MRTVTRITNNLNVGGVQKRIASVSPLLSKEFRINIVTYREKGELFDAIRNDNIHPHFLKIHGKLHPLSILRLSRFLKKTKTSITHTHSLGANIPGIIASALANTPVRIAQIHRKNLHWYSNSYLQQKKHIVIESIVHRLFTDKILFVSQESLEYFQSKTNIPCEKLFLLHNGIQIPSITFSKSEIRRKLNLPSEKKIIGFVGRLSQGKGADFFIDFAQKAMKHDNSLFFLMIGGGPEYENICAHIKDKKLENKILLVGHQADLNKWYSALDMLLFTSEPDAEGMPGVILEACAHGLPILARKSAPLEEIYTYYPRILFIDDSNHPLIDILNTLKSIPCSIEKFKNEFSIEYMAKRTSALYNKLLQEKNIN